MAKFSGLSFDVVLHILSFLSAQDIILGPRQTCLGLHSASKNLSLWKCLLQRICAENALFLATFPPRMTLKDLEHATSSPERFLSKLRPHIGCEPPLKPYDKTYIDVDYLEREPIDYSEEVSGLYLVPGGRFLFSEQKSDERATEIFCWDLGMPGEHKDMKDIPIATLSDRAFGIPHPAHPKRGGAGILLFCVNGTRDQDVFIYEIHPSFTCSGFHLVVTTTWAVAAGSSKTSACALTFDKLAMVYNGNVCLWNFIANTKATWSTPESLSNLISIVDNVILKDTYIIVYYRNVLLIWNIPDLYPSDSASATRSQHLEPCYRVDLFSTQIYPLSPPYLFLPMIYDRPMALNDWYNDSNHPLYFDSMTKIERDIQTYRCRLRLPSAVDEDPTFSIHTIPIHNEMYDFFEYPEEYRLCDGHIHISWCSPGQGCEIWPSVTSDTTYEVKAAWFDIEIENVEQQFVSLCPASGRAVYYMPMMHYFAVVDFLPYPFVSCDYCGRRHCSHFPEY